MCAVTGRGPRCWNTGCARSLARLGRVNQTVFCVSLSVQQWLQVGLKDSPGLSARLPSRRRARWRKGNHRPARSAAACWRWSRWRRNREGRARSSSSSGGERVVKDNYSAMNAKQVQQTLLRIFARALSSVLCAVSNALVSRELKTLSRVICSPDTRSQITWIFSRAQRQFATNPILRRSNTTGAYLHRL